jgi:hypothetical protein
MANTRQMADADPLVARSLDGPHSRREHQRNPVSKFVVKEMRLAVAGEHVLPASKLLQSHLCGHATGSL